MARHDVHRLRDGELVVDVQSDLIDGTGSRIVLPLMPPAGMPRPAPRLHPIVTFDGMDHVVASHLISAVPSNVMGPPLGSLRDHADSLTRAIDTLLTDW